MLIILLFFLSANNLLCSDAHNQNNTSPFHPDMPCTKRYQQYYLLCLNQPGCCPISNEKGQKTLKQYVQKQTPTMQENEQKKYNDDLENYIQQRFENNIEEACAECLFIPNTTLAALSCYLGYPFLGASSALCLTCLETTKNL